MTSQYNLVHPAAREPAVNAQRVQINDKIAQTVAVRIEAQRSFMVS